MLALKSIDFLPWPQKGKRFHPSLFCLTAALENFRMVTFFHEILNCVYRQSCMRSKQVVSEKCIQSKIIQSFEWSTQHFQGLTEANLTIIVVAALPCLCPPGRYPQNWMGHENDIGVRAANGRYCNTHHGSSGPLTIYFCIILFVCVYWCRVRSVVGRLSRNLISHKHETSRHTERDQVSRP